MPYPAASCVGVALSPSHSGARRKLVQALDTIGRLRLRLTSHELGLTVQLGVRLRANRALPGTRRSRSDRFPVRIYGIRKVDCKYQVRSR